MVPRPREFEDSVCERQALRYTNVFKGLDPVTGKLEIDPDHKPGTNKRADFCPGSHGGKTWPPAAFSPKTRMIYFPANNNMCSSNMGTKAEYRPGRGFVGIGGSRPFTVPGADHFGEVQACNIDRGQKVWAHNHEKSPNWGSMLATADGLLFSVAPSTASCTPSMRPIRCDRIGMGRRFTR